jgi:hypothetical protein
MERESSSFRFHVPMENNSSTEGNTAEPKDIGVKDMFKYYSFQLGQAFLIIPCLSGWTVVNLTWPSIQNSQNMNLTAEQSSEYLSLVSSAYFAGAVIGCILS